MNKKQFLRKVYEEFNDNDLIAPVLITGAMVERAAADINMPIDTTIIEEILAEIAADPWELEQIVDNMIYEKYLELTDG